MLGEYRNNGKEHGNYSYFFVVYKVSQKSGNYSRFRVLDLGFRVLSRGAE